MDVKLAKIIANHYTKLVCNNGIKLNCLYQFNRYTIKIINYSYSLSLTFSQKRK